MQVFELIKLTNNLEKSIILKLNDKSLVNLNEKNKDGASIVWVNSIH